MRKMKNKKAQAIALFFLFVVFLSTTSLLFYFNFVVPDKIEERESENYNNIQAQIDKISSYLFYHSEDEKTPIFTHTLIME
jgi:hypothetical protein